MIKYNWELAKKSPWDIANHPWTDSQGNEWRVYIQLKRIKGRIVPTNFQLLGLSLLFVLDNATQNTLYYSYLVKLVHRFF